MNLLDVVRCLYKLFLCSLLALLFGFGENFGHLFGEFWSANI